MKGRRLAEANQHHHRHRRHLHLHRRPHLRRRHPPDLKTEQLATCHGIGLAKRFDLIVQVTNLFGRLVNKR